MKARQRGVAMVVVVWFIAAMSLVVGGIVALARVESGTTGLHVARAKVVAAGDGAINLTMAARQSRATRAGDTPPAMDSLQRIGELEVLVRVIPADGFVDLNQAPAELLAALFRHAGGMDSSQAQTVANNVVKWRSATRSDQGRDAGEPARFYSLEDLLRVEGVNRSVLDGVRNFVVAGDWASGGMNWDSAPSAMLPVLDAVDPSRGNTARERRSARSQRATPAASGSGVYRVDALVEYGGRLWLRRRWVQTGGAVGSSLPWHVLRTEAPRVVKE
ncbi:general secretion pathway protein GspK [Mangrovimicrobium sediminis]|uniref:General secretion pathway protein GspK n=1 Tax=Mangrovimicrobium sediminis TaxID=2562682 RepID=A0A4Z0M3S1_9GAMM|nr:general secretion pathway protein GspK [Haliea sp. SAOS-164]TGD74104.1 general secretion pathway protein GspK [Haliea sp. SAOS-164]